MHYAAVITSLFEKIKNSCHIVRKIIVILIVCKKYKFFVYRFFWEQIERHWPKPKEKYFSSEQNNFFLNTIHKLTSLIGNYFKLDKHNRLAVTDVCNINIFSVRYRRKIWEFDIRVIVWFNQYRLWKAFDEKHL